MATQLQIRRGTTSQMNAFTGAEGELAVNTTTDTVHVHDGSTAGGFALAKADGSNIATYAGSFTTISASGAITGNVTGNLTGSVTGNVTGDVTGDLTGSILTAAQTNITSVGTLSTLAVTGTATMGGLTLDGNNSYTSNIKFDYGASAPTYFSNWGYKSSSDGNKVFLTMTDGGAAKDVLVANYNGFVGIGTSTPDTTLHLQTPTGTKSEINFAQTAVTNYRIGVPASTDALVFTYGASTERLTIASDGKINIGGVGNISPYGIRFAINGTGSGGAGLYFGSGVIIPTDNTPTITDANVDLGASNYRFKDLHLSGTASMAGLSPGIVTISSGSYFIGNTAAGYRFNNAANTSNLMILKDNGDLMVGTTAAYSARFTVQGEANQNAVTVRVGTNGYPAINFQNTSGAQQGYIVTNASSVSLVSVSDQRLKQNIADADDAGSKLDAIQVRQFDWIADGSHQDYGMIAQELQAVAPEAVSGDSDSENMMGVDYSKLVPMMLKEIQSLRTRVQELENT